MKTNINIQNIQAYPTPFYYYDRHLLEATLDEIVRQMPLAESGCVHYAVKANANPQVLQMIASRGFGADCVSGWEIKRCIDNGFKADRIVFAGVGKTDAEIQLALKCGIDYFNAESLEELSVINDIACSLQTIARVSLRINPNVGAHTHSHISTGLNANKFGIDMTDMLKAITTINQLSNLRFVGLHFHIGSQITNMEDFASLAHRINEIQNILSENDIDSPEVINVGGGLGIDYDNPDVNAIPDFKGYFDTYRQHLNLRDGQHLHFELGRSIVGQMGSLITKVLYIKTNSVKKFAIVDAGFTDLIRPALYGASHKIENVSCAADAPQEVYDVVGPICESTDVFAKAYKLPVSKRGDLLALRSAGAYGEIMASGYNCRPLPQGHLI